MESTYEEIVRRWYREMRPKFIMMLMDRYAGSRMRLTDAENIYQDVFLAIQENLKEGRIKENTVWSSYIMTIGMNLANNLYRRIGRENYFTYKKDTDADRQEEIDSHIDTLLQSIHGEDDSVYNDEEARELLNEELVHTPEPCASLIKLTYYSDLSDREIMEELPRYGSPVVVRTRRWQCMQDLIYRVKLALFYHGIIDKKPERRKKNG